MTGRILQGIGGFYTVEAEGQSYVCKARGRFRKQKLTPMVGDVVQFTPGAPEDEGSVDAILPRVSLLDRPPVANVERIVIVVAASAPEPDLLLVDRLLVQAARAGIAGALCVNKCDLGLESAQRIETEYAASGVPVLMACAQQGQGVEAVREYIAGRLVTFAGQSGVGKSSLLNRICPGVQMEVGRVSRIERGRHTTRRAELFPLPGGGYLADTPGFSLLEMGNFDPELLKDYYEEMKPYEGACRFQGCRHLKEPGCAVKQASARGEISPQRLERYALLYQELKEKWGNRYG